MIFLLSLIQGMWVVRWEIPDVPSALKMVEDAARYGITDIFLQVYARGEVLYPSSFIPRFEELRTREDLLSLVLEEAHKRGIRVHAWLNLFYTWSQAPFPPHSHHITRKYPQWFVADRTGRSIFTYSIDELKKKGLPGYFTSPFSDIYEYLLKMVKEVLSYPVDGIHLDYVRYPAPYFGYELPARNYFYSRYGVDFFQDPLISFFNHRALEKMHMEEKKKRITELVREIRKLSRGKILSVACLPDPEEAERLGQDWVGWLKEGLIDYAVPMTYTASPEWFRKRIKKYPRDKVLPGIGGYLTDCSIVKKEIKITKDMGFKGWVIFSYGSSDLTCLQSSTQ